MPHFNRASQIKITCEKGLPYDHAVIIVMLMGFEQLNIADSCHAPTGNYIETGHVTEARGGVNINTHQHGITVNIGEEDASHTQGVHLMAELNHLDSARLLPTMSCHFTITRVQAHDNAFCSPAL